MDTSDDPITATFVALGASQATAAVLTTATIAAAATAGTVAATGGFSSRGGKSTIPGAARAEPPTKRTAMPAEQLSERAKKARKRAASLITRDWGAPKLSQTGLLGLGGQELP